MVLNQHQIQIRIPSPQVPIAIHLVLPPVRNLTPLLTPQGQGQGNGIANVRGDFEVAQTLKVLKSRVEEGRSNVSFIPCFFLLSIL